MQDKNEQLPIVQRTLRRCVQLARLSPHLRVAQPWQLSLHLGCRVSGQLLKTGQSGFERAALHALGDIIRYQQADAARDDHHPCCHVFRGCRCCRLAKPRKLSQRTSKTTHMEPQEIAGIATHSQNRHETLTRIPRRCFLNCFRTLRQHHRRTSLRLLQSSCHHGAVRQQTPHTIHPHARQLNTARRSTLLAQTAHVLECQEMLWGKTSMGATAWAPLPTGHTAILRTLPALAAPTPAATRASRLPRQEKRSAAHRRRHQSFSYASPSSLASSESGCTRSCGVTPSTSSIHGNENIHGLVVNPLRTASL